MWRVNAKAEFMLVGVKDWKEEKKKKINNNTLHRKNKLNLQKLYNVAIKELKV